VYQTADPAGALFGLEAREISSVSQADVVGFIHPILANECGMHVRRQLESSVSQFFDRFHPDTHLFMAYYRNNGLIGLLGVDRRSETTAVLKWVFVAPNARRFGLGGHLVDLAIQFSRRRGYLRLVLCTGSGMPDAHRLYLKKGFTFKENVTLWRRSMQILARDLVAAAQ
jgi:GNAT superfamily N-acetyltransferase